LAGYYSRSTACGTPESGLCRIIGSGRVAKWRWALAGSRPLAGALAQPGSADFEFTQSFTVWRL